MPFNPQTAVTATVSRLEAVTSLGVVHARRRTVRTEAQANQLLVDEATHKINAAFVSIVAMTVGTRDSGQPAPTLGAGVNNAAGALTSFRIQVELFRGLEDADELASEERFRDTVFDVIQAFNKVGKVDPGASHQDPMSATSISYIMLADSFLMHYALCQYELRGRTSP